MYVIDDFVDYYIDELVIPKERFNEFNRFIDGRNLYKKTHIIPGAIETIKRLYKIYNVFICSSCINPFNIENSGRLFKDKYEFLRETLPFINPNNFIFTNAKHLIKADIIIDDRVPNLESDIKTKILFPSYHNKDISEEELQQKDIIRAGYDWRTGWHEVGNLLIPDYNISNEHNTLSYKKKR